MIDVNGLVFKDVNFTVLFIGFLLAIIIVQVIALSLIELGKILIGGYQVWRDGEYYEDGEWKTKQCR